MEQDEPHHGVRQGWFGYLGQLIKGVNLKQDGHFVLDAAHGNILGQVAGWLTSHQVDEADERGDTLLHVAARLRNPFLANLLLANGAEINAQNLEGNTPLHIAVTVGSRPIVRLLVGSHADVNIPNHADETPMHIAMRQRAWLIMIYLIENDGQFNMRDADNNTLLHLAAHDGQLELAQVLVRRDHDIIDAVNRVSDTALHIALRQNQRDIVVFLLNHGANLLLINSMGNTIFHAAAQSRNDSLGATLLQVDGVKTILGLPTGDGLFVNLRNQYVVQEEPLREEPALQESGDTALHIAARYGLHLTIALLLKNMASKEILNRAGLTAYQVAFRLNHKDILDSLYVPTYRDSVWSLVKSSSAYLRPVVGPVVYDVVSKSSYVGPAFRRIEGTIKAKIGVAAMETAYKTVGLPVAHEQAVSAFGGGRGLKSTVNQLVNILFAQNKVLKTVVNVGSSIGNVSCAIL